MFNKIDAFLNKITMYRLVLYVLVACLCFGALVAAGGFLPYAPLAIVCSAIVFVAFCWVVNEACAYFFSAPTNVESVYITACICALIVAPSHSLTDIQFYATAFFVSLVAMASKYVCAIGKKHVFNPAAIAVAVTAVMIHQSANWWAGSATMLPVVTIGCFLIIKKIQRFDVVGSFLFVALATIAWFGFARGTSPVVSVVKALVDSPLIFFAGIMLTEPLTMPPQRAWRVVYGVLVGVLIAPAVHVGSVYSTPELALIVGNVFSYLVSPKEKILLQLIKRVRVAQDTFNFHFASDQNFSFYPGQYLEWTLPHDAPDNRGNRRYFTIASSPTEGQVILGVKINERASSFKRSLMALPQGSIIAAGARAGEFVLPQDQNKKLCFIAGGIGITPFRSMIKFLLDSGQRRDCVLLYSNKTERDIAYKNMFDRAGEVIGLKTYYTLTDATSVGDDWQGGIGYLDAETIARVVPDFRERYFYISGPHGMVTGFSDTLAHMGVPTHHIKKDFFPGFV